MFPTDPWPSAAEAALCRLQLAAARVNTQKFERHLLVGSLAPVLPGPCAPVPACVSACTLPRFAMAAATTSGDGGAAMETDDDATPASRPSSPPVAATVGVESAFS